MQKLGAKWKNEAKKSELESRDISGLLKLSANFKKHGRGEVFLPRKQSIEQDEFNLNSFLIKHGKFPFLPECQYKALYLDTWDFRIPYRNRFKNYKYFPQK